MTEPEQVRVTPLSRQKILDQLQAGVRTWEQLRALIKVNEDHLGVTLMELLNQRKIWVAQRNDVRVYGLERRSGLRPRFSHPQRRAADGQFEQPR